MIKKKSSSLFSRHCCQRTNVPQLDCVLITLQILRALCRCDERQAENWQRCTCAASLPRMLLEFQRGPTAGVAVLAVRAQRLPTRVWCWQRGTIARFTHQPDRELSLLGTVYPTLIQRCFVIQNVLAIARFTHESDRVSQIGYSSAGSISTIHTKYRKRVWCAAGRWVGSHDSRTNQTVSSLYSSGWR